MENALFIALSHQSTLLRQMDVIANNIANSSTPAFKVDRMLFIEELVTTDDGQELTFVKDAGIARDTTEGGFTNTGNDLDLAIHGGAYFVVDTPLGMRYTQNGRFSLDANSQLVTSQGDLVLAESGGPIVIPPDALGVEIAPDGTVSTEDGEVGRLNVVRFDDDQALEKAGNSLYAAEIPSLPAPGAVIVQGMVEESNVEPIIEITTMLHVLRAYEAAQRIIDTEEDLATQTMDTLTTA
ncbi:MAG: flagellar basal-body rod protein FlgF [Alphaproteobacteria bacterium]